MELVSNTLQICEDYDWVPEAKHWTFYTVEFWFGFDLIVTAPWFSLLGVRRYLP